MPTLAEIKFAREKRDFAREMILNGKSAADAREAVEKKFGVQLHYRDLHIINDEIKAAKKATRASKVKPAVITAPQRVSAYTATATAEGAEPAVVLEPRPVDPRTNPLAAPEPTPAPPNATAMRRFVITLDDHRIEGVQFSDGVMKVHPGGRASFEWLDP